MTIRVVQLGRRSLTRIYRQPAQFVFPLAFPLMLLLINGSALSVSALLPGFPAPSYRAFWLSNPFVFGAVTLATILGGNMARDIETGFLDRLVLTPVSGIGLLAGHLAGGAVVAFVNGCIYLAAGWLLGVEIASGWAGVPVILTLGVLTALFFGGAGTFIALRVGTAEAVEGLFPIFFVFLFLSSANFPRPLMTVDWFRTLATLNPMSYVIEAIRSLINDGWNGTALARGFGVATVLAAVALVGAGAAARHRVGRA